MARPKWTTILGCVLLFLFFVFLTFPFQNLRGYIFGKIFQSTHILVVAEDLYPTLFGWPGLVAKNTAVTIPMGNGEMDLSADRLYFRLGIGGLIPPAPAFIVSMKDLKKGGNLYFRIVPNRSRTSGAVSADDVNLKQISIPGLAEPLPGTLNLDSDFSFDQTELPKSTGNATLHIGKLKIPTLNLQGFIIPSLNIGDIKGKLTMKNGLAELHDFTFGAKGSDISGSIAGDLRLGQNINTSFLNLTLRIRVSELYRQNPQAVNLTSVLDGFKTATPGEYAMKWSATLGDLQTNIVAAIPQKVP